MPAMRRRRALLALLLLLVIAGAVAFALTRSSRAIGPVYTVAQVATGLANQPQAWAGRTVTVRGTLVLVEWAIQVRGVYVGPGQAGCADATHCALQVPTN